MLHLCGAVNDKLYAHRVELMRTCHSSVYTWHAYTCSSLEVHEDWYWNLLDCVLMLHVVYIVYLAIQSYSIATHLALQEAKLRVCISELPQHCTSLLLNVCAMCPLDIDVHDSLSQLLPALLLLVQLIVNA
jgi:hypothetical protein